MGKFVLIYWLEPGKIVRILRISRLEDY